MHAIRLILIALTFVAAAASAQDRGRELRDRPSRSGDEDTAQTLTDADIRSLVARLESPDFGEREAADTLLRTVGMRATDALAVAFQRTDDFEAQIRIQHIVESVFFWDRVYGKNAFLGIQHAAVNVQQRPDPRVPQDRGAIYINRVIPNTSAARAGIQAGDLIVGIDGEVLDSGTTAADVAERIRTKKPRAPLSLDLYRGDQPIHVEVRLGPRPAEHYDRGAAPQELLDQRDNARVEFANWWTARFGTAPFNTESLDTRTRPAYLEFPDDYERP